MSASYLHRCCQMYARPSSYGWSAPVNRLDLQVKSAKWRHGAGITIIVRKAVRKLERWMFEVDPPKRYISIDTGAVLERSFGERGALGWIGRSTMLIHQGSGPSAQSPSFSLHIPEPRDPRHPNRCGRCTDCISACPTKCTHRWASRCPSRISYWTIEHHGMIQTDMRPMLGEWVFGCDICQDVALEQQS